MAQRSVQGDQELARKIKQRRNELNLTIEEAASRAGVGTKTWSRYEAGESIRWDKCRGICKALNWRDFPDGKNDAEKKSLVEEYRDHEAWSQFLADNYGSGAAVAFAAGSDILLDYINQDQSDLASMPSGSHIGQLSTSFISEELPPQFLMRYDYEFLYNMKCVLIELRERAKHGMPMTAHSILEELIIYLCNEEAQALIEVGAGADDLADNKELDDSEDWVFNMFDDMDIITFLYSNQYLAEDHPFHFKYWGDKQFYMD
jgi:transcriptional regulator with XRE-family HTH domain